MTVRRPAKVEAALIAKGMRPDENHHTMLRMSVDGVTHLVTRISHGSREIDNYLGSLMAKQCCLRLAEFWELVDCPMSAERWEALVRERCPDGRNPFLRSGT